MTTVYLHTHAADTLRKLAKPQHLLDFLRRLQANPTETVGDYTQPDPRGRTIEVKVLGRHAVLFFKDPFADIVKILDIRNTEAL